MNWTKRYRIARAEKVKYFGESLAVRDTNSAKSVWRLYR